MFTTLLVTLTIDETKDPEEREGLQCMEPNVTTYLFMKEYLTFLEKYRIDPSHLLGISLIEWTREEKIPEVIR